MPRLLIEVCTEDDQRKGRLSLDGEALGCWRPLESHAQRLLDAFWAQASLSKISPGVVSAWNHDEARLFMVREVSQLRSGQWT
jgi:hypothetical protein